MDENPKTNKIGIIILLVFIAGLGLGKNSKISDLNNRIEDYKDALAEANYNIKKARDYAGSSYDDMGYALENLEIAEVIPAPYDEY